MDIRDSECVDEVDDRDDHHDHHDDTSASLPSAAGSGSTASLVRDETSSIHKDEGLSHDQDGDDLQLTVHGNFPLQLNRHNSVDDRDLQEKFSGRAEKNMVAHQYGQERAMSPQSKFRSGSPKHHAGMESEADNIFGNIETRGSASSDLEQFYGVSSHRFSVDGCGSDHPDAQNYDDLPLMFSVPAGLGEDDSTKVYSCNICSFRTAFKNSLVNHQAVHSDVRPWVCDVCDYAAKRKQDLKKHLQTMHGMVIDSLQLRPGISPSALALSVPASVYSGVGSPIEMKPVIIDNIVVSGDHSSAGGIFSPKVAGLSNSSVTPQQQLPASFGQPLPPSLGKLNQMLRSQAVPAVGKFIADKFPFNQYFAEHSRTLPHFSTDLCNRRNFESGTESESERLEDDDVTSDDQSLHILNATLARNSSARQADLGKNHSRKSVEDQYSSHAASEAAVRGRNLHGYKTEISDHGRADARERNLKVLSSQHDLGLTIASRSEETGHSIPHFTQKLKRPVEFNNSETVLLAKSGRFHSPSSDTERSPQVSSQSGNTEAVSSITLRSRATESDRCFHCQHCNIMFFENALFLMHMGLHDNTNPWKCSICERTFFEKYSFTSHFINQH